MQAWQHPVMIAAGIICACGADTMIGNKPGDCSEQVNCIKPGPMDKIIKTGN